MKLNVAIGNEKYRLGIITEQDIPRTLVNNLKRIRNAHMVMSYPKLTKEVLQLLEKFVVYLNDSVVCLEQSLEFLTEKIN